MATVNSFETLDTLFNTSPTIPVDSNLPAVVESQPPQSRIELEEEDDVQFARQNLRELAAKADKAIDELTDLARQSEAPRMYEVLSTMINAAAATSKQLVDMHKQRGSGKPNTQSQSGQTVTNQQNIVFTGSPAELLRNLKALNEPK